jgi:Fe-S oxidoreductase
MEPDFSAPGHVGRQIYWNIEIPEPWRTILIVILGFVPLVMVALAIRKRWAEWKAVGGIDMPPRSEWGARARRVLQHTLAQKRVVRRKLGGWSHVMFFYGFVILFVGTVIVAFQHDVARPLGWYFFEGTFYRLFSITLDAAGIVATAGVIAALWRRYRIRPQHLGGSIDWIPSLWWLLASLVTGYLVEGLRIAGTGFPQYEKLWSFFGWSVASLFAGFGNQTLRVMHLASWWGHFAICLYFLGLAAGAAMSHIWVIALNVFMARETPSGASPRPIEDIENATSFGVTTVDQFLGFHLRDADACVQCGRCTEVCPANLTGKPLSPKKIVNDIRDAFREELLPRRLEGNMATGEELGLKPLVGEDGRIHPDEVWSCTTCGACEQECPAQIEIIEKIVQLRRGLTLMRSEFPPELQNGYNNLEQQGNPWGKPPHEREQWAEQLEADEQIAIPRVGTPEAEGAEYLFWVGCAGAFDTRAIPITKSTARLLTKAGVKFAILGQQETCTGDPAMRTGQEYLYQILAKQNIETLKAAGIPKVVASCPHCFQTIKKDYKALGLDLKVVHHSDLLAQLVAEGRIPSGKVEANAILHDSCYLARHNRIEEQPRAVAAAALGAPIAEPRRCGDKGLCCGAGGGRMWMEEHLGHKNVNVERAEELLANGHDTVVTACPFCKTMVTDGSRIAAPDRKVTVMDIAELLDKATAGKK